MAPYVPEEVDVYLVPHLRMKELVNDCKEKCYRTNFSGDMDLEELLSTLIKTFVEFKNHEMIENTLIMKKLKRKLKKLSIRNSAVCNCHKDSHLIDMLKMLKEGYSKKTEQDRLNYGLQLRSAMEEFAEDFLPHMKEEEETFLPLLQKYFTYEELKDMRSKVLDKHFCEKPGENQVDDILQAEELEKWALDQLVKESSSSAVESDEEHRAAGEELLLCSVAEEAEPEPIGVDALPPEVLVKVMNYLNPRDLCRSAQVCKQWSTLAMDLSLWKELHPVQWANGDWDYTGSYNLDFEEEDDDDYSGCYQGDSEERYVVIDDDADVDESEMPDDDTDEEHGDIIRQLQREGRILLGLKNYVTAKVGESVRVLNLHNSRAVTSGVMQKLLRHCPNLETLDLSHTRISDSALKGVGKNYCCSYLKHLILTGCHSVTDATLMRLAMAVNKSLMGPDAASDSSSEEDCGTCVKLRKCVCVKYENLKQRIRQCKDAEYTATCCEKDAEYETDKEKRTCQVDLDKDIDETQAKGNDGGDKSRNEETFGRKAEYARTFDASSAEETFDICCDKNLGADGVGKNGGCGNQGNWFDKTLCGFYGDPRDFCATRCAAGRAGLKPETNESIEDCSWQWPPGGDLRNEAVRDVMASQCAQRRDDDVCEDVHWETAGDIDKTVVPGEESEEVRLEYLSLSGCYQITDTGLRALFGYGPLPRLRHLDLSGCVNVTPDALTALVHHCSALDASRLFYCDNIPDGPCADTANGCNNVGCSRRFCCRT